MNNILYYLFEVNCSLMLGAALYFLVIKGLSFFQWNRYYLIGICLLSLLLPFGKFRMAELFFSSVTTAPEVAEVGQVLNTIQAGGDLFTEVEMADSLWSSISLGHWIAYLYLLGTVLLLLRCIVRYITLRRRIRQLHPREYRGIYHRRSI
jgi:N-acetylmuramoyl-L-alanine amidase